MQLHAPPGLVRLVRSDSVVMHRHVQIAVREIEIAVQSTELVEADALPAYHGLRLESPPQPAPRSTLPTLRDDLSQRP